MHNPESVLENETRKVLFGIIITETKGPTILWDFAIQTERKIKIHRLDIMVKDDKRKNIPLN